MFDLQTMKLFFALLALATNVAVVGFGIVWVAAIWSERAADLKTRFYDLVAGQEMLFGAIVSGTAMLGSLYLSEIANLPPCRLCWYQRFAMYPIAVVLAVAAWRREVRVRIPVLLAALIGGAISIYHYLIQWFPQLEGTSCSIAVPCTAAWFRVFGFVSIPYMALSAFAFVVVMMVALRANSTRDASAEALTH
jgi:disulfide bond formation protein DsbB